MWSNYQCVIKFWLLLYKSINDNFRSFLRATLNSISGDFFLLVWNDPLSVQQGLYILLAETTLCCMSSFNTQPMHLCLRYHAVFSLHLAGNQTGQNAMFPSVFSILPHLRSYGFFPLGGKSKWCFFDSILFTKMAQNATSLNKMESRRETAEMSLCQSVFQST